MHTTINQWKVENPTPTQTLQLYVNPTHDQIMSQTTYVYIQYYICIFIHVNQYPVPIIDRRPDQIEPLYTLHTTQNPPVDSYPETSK